MVKTRKRRVIEAREISVYKGLSQSLHDRKIDIKFEYIKLIHFRI